MIRFFLPHTVPLGTGTVPPNPFRYYPAYFGIAIRYEHKNFIDFLYIVYRYRKTPQTLPLLLLVRIFGRYMDEHGGYTFEITDFKIQQNEIRYHPIDFGIAIRYTHTKFIFFFLMHCRYRKTPQTLLLLLAMQS